jgi:hypothetical protein
MAGPAGDEAVDHVLVERIAGRHDGSVIDVTRRASATAAEAAAGRAQGAGALAADKNPAAAPYGLAC